MDHGEGLQPLIDAANILPDPVVPETPVPQPAVAQPVEEAKEEVAIPPGPSREIGFEDLAPGQFISEGAKLRVAKEAADAKPDFGTVYKAAAELENTMSFLFQGAPDLIPEDNYQISKDRFKELTADLPPDLHEAFGEATSDAHAEVIREKMLSLITLEKTLANYGWKGMGVRMLAAILDPGALAISLASDGIAAPFIYGAKVGRLGRALRAGMVAGGANAGIELLIAAENPLKTPLDILFAATGGLVLGGAIGGALPSRMGLEQARILQDMNDTVFKREIAAAGGVLTEKGERTLRASAPRVHADAPKVRADAPVTRQPVMDILDVETGQHLSAGAAQAEGSFIPTISELKGSTDSFLAADADAPVTVYGNFRFDMAAILKRSPFGPIRGIGNRWLEDGLGNVGEAAASETADLMKTVLYKRTILAYHEVYQPAYRAWAQGQGLGAMRRSAPAPRRRFGEEVADALENPTAKKYHPEVVKAAARQAELSASLLKELKKAGVKGFQNIPEDVTYFTRRWRYDHIVRANQELGTPAVVSLLKGAIMRKSEGIPEELAERIATGMNHTLRNVHYGRDIDMGRIFAQDGKAAFKEALEDAGILGADEFDELLGKLDPTKGADIPGIAKFRVRLDTTFEENGLSIRSLLDRDAETVFDAYASQASGRIAMARQGIASDGDFIKLKDELRAAADEVQDYTVKQLNRDLEILDISYALILGRPSPLIKNPASRRNRLLKLIMDYNFIRVMGQVGFAQIPELANVMGQGGLRTLLQQVPEFGSLLRSARKGKHDTVSSEVEAWMGLGRDRLIHQASLRFDPEEGLVNADDLIGRLSTYAQVGRRFVADVSGMAPITDFSSRIAARTVVQNLTDSAFKLGKRINTSRLEQMGLNAVDAEAVFNQIRKHALVEDSLMFGNKKIRKINLEDWTDEAARDAFIMAVTRTTRRWIQQNDVGNLSQFMTGSLGKMLVQFRVFSIIAYNKQFLVGVHNRDMRAAVSFLGATFLAGTSYVMQQSINSVGRSDAAEFLEERLSIASIGLASFQRAGYATLFPGVIDTVAGFYQDKPIFAYGRTTGLAADLLTGNPTVDLFKNLQFAAQGFTRAMLNEEFDYSQQDLRNIKSTLALQNVTGVRNVLSLLGTTLPKRSK